MGLEEDWTQIILAQGAILGVGVVVLHADLELPIDFVGVVVFGEIPSVASRIPIDNAQNTTHQTTVVRQFLNSVGNINSYLNYFS